MKSRVNSKSKDITKVYLIKSSKNTRLLKLPTDEKQEIKDDVLENFYTTHEDFALLQDFYLQVCRDKIRIFNRDGKLVMTYSNFKF